MYDTLLETLDNMRVQYTIKPSNALLHAIGDLEHCIQHIKEIDYELAHNDLIVEFNSKKKELDLANSGLLAKQSDIALKLRHIGSVMEITPDIEAKAKENWTSEDESTFKSYSDEIDKLQKLYDNKVKVI